MATEDESERASTRDWPRWVTSNVVAQVRAWMARSSPARTVAGLARETGIPRPVLSNLLNGKRESISVAEVLVLARALVVPPALLLVPINEAPKVEILPGTEMSTAAALDWLAGLDGAPADPIKLREAGIPFHWVRPDLTDAQRLAEDAREHQEVSGSLRVDMAEVELAPDDKELRTMAYHHFALLRRTRERFKVPPALSAELAWVDAIRTDKNPDPSLLPTGWNPGDPLPWQASP